MAVLLSRAEERRSREIRARSARERAAKPRGASAPIFSRFLCPRPTLLLSAPNQNRHATQATKLMSFTVGSYRLREGERSTATVLRALLKYHRL